MSRRITSRNTENTSLKTVVSGSKTVTLKDLESLRVRIPPAVQAAGFVVVLRVLNDGRVEAGLVEQEKVPKLISISETNKLGLARTIVAGAETVSTKSETADKIKTLAATNLILESWPAEPKISAQAETLRLKTVVDKLEANLRYLSQAVTVTSVTNFLIRQLSQSITCIRKYLLECQFTRRSEDKLADILLDNGVSKFIYDRFSSEEVKDLHSNPVENYLFPRRLSRGMYLTVKEIERLKPDIIEGSPMSSWLDFGRTCLDSVKVTETMYNDKVYLPPLNFKERLFSFDDLPREQATLSQPAMRSVLLINAMFGNFRPSEISEGMLQKHLASFMYSPGTGSSSTSVLNKFAEEDFADMIALINKEKDIQSKSKVPDLTRIQDLEDRLEEMKKDVIKFTHDTSSPLSIKEQYFTFCETHKIFDRRKLSFVPKGLPSPYNLTIIGRVNSPLLFGKPTEATYMNFYHPADLSELNQLKLEPLKAKMPAITYAKPREFDFQRISPLTKNALDFIKVQRKKGAPKDLVETYESFLCSFTRDELANAALRIMQANMRVSFDDYEEENQDNADTSDVDNPW